MEFSQRELTLIQITLEGGLDASSNKATSSAVSACNARTCNRTGLWIISSRTQLTDCLRFSTCVVYNTLQILDFLLILILTLV